MKPLIELVYQDEQERIVHEYIAWFPAMKVVDVLRIPQFAHLKGRKMGVYSKIVAEDSDLSENDRLEFYLPLIIDPKEARRLRAKKNKKPR
ncbi:MAG: RnfH family protein [Gammaproteobacteria bacterium]|nr:RnfH family protein [Gammaproteobacteria bacterium]